MIRRLFTDIAGVYDRMNHLLSLGMDRRWRRIAAAEAKGSPARVLDIACGTGDFAFELARRFTDAEVLGVDFAPAMLDLARRKNSSSRVTFAEGDALNLSDVRDGTFHLCTCAFGFRNFADRSKALQEVRRVLASGGELMVLEFFRPRNAVLGFAVSSWIWLAASLFAHCRASAYRHLRDSIGNMVAVEEFVLMAEESGFRLYSDRWFFPCCRCLHFVSGAESVKTAKARSAA